MNCDHCKSKLAAVVICLASLSQVSTAAAPTAPPLNDVQGLHISDDVKSFLKRDQCKGLHSTPLLDVLLQPLEFSKTPKGITHNDTCIRRYPSSRRPTVDVIGELCALAFVTLKEACLGDFAGGGSISPALAVKPRPEVPLREVCAVLSDWVKEVRWLDLSTQLYGSACFKTCVDLGTAPEPGASASHGKTVMVSNRDCYGLYQGRQLLKALKGSGPTASGTPDGASGNKQAGNLKSSSTEAHSGVRTASATTSASSAPADAVTNDAVTPEDAVTIGVVHVGGGKAALNAAANRDAINPAGVIGDKSGASVAHAAAPQGNGRSGAVAAEANQADGDTGKGGTLPAVPPPNVSSAPDKVNKGSPKVTDSPGVSSSVAPLKNGGIPVPTQAPVTPSQPVMDARQLQAQSGPVPKLAPGSDGAAPVSGAVPPLQAEPAGDSPTQQAASGAQDAAPAPAPAQEPGDPAPAPAAGAVYPGREKSPDGEKSPKNAASESNDIAKQPASASASESAMRAAAAAAAGDVAEKPAVSDTLPEEEEEDKLPSSAAEKPPVLEEAPPAAVTAAAARGPPPPRPTASAPLAALPEPHYPDSVENESPAAGGARGDDDFSINELQPVYKAPSGLRPGLDQQPGLGPYVGGALPAQGGDSNFFAYFLTAVVLCIVLYLAFHNKQKILALVIEGRNSGGRRRPHSSQYRRLDNSLEEAISSQQRREVANSIVY